MTKQNQANKKTQDFLFIKRQFQSNNLVSVCPICLVATLELAFNK